MNDETVGWFLAIPWAIRALATSVMFPFLLGCFVKMACCQHRAKCKCSSSPDTGTSSQSSSSAELLRSVATEDDTSPDTLTKESFATCNVSLWILRYGTAISATVFGCFGLAVNTPILFVLCSIEGLAAVWDAACTVLLSTLVDRHAIRRQHAQDLLEDERQSSRTHNVESDQGSVLGLRALLQTSMACIGQFIFSVRTPIDFD